jgi:hypothetical protein
MCGAPSGEERTVQVARWIDAITVVDLTKSAAALDRKYETS